MLARKKLLDFFKRQQERKLVAKAYELAKKIHVRHKRDNDDYYFVHPYRVALILLDEFSVRDANLIAAALLHDVLEMSETSKSELEKIFNKKVSRYAELVTKPKKYKNKKERDKKYYSKIKRASYETQLLKFSDRLDNIRDLKNAPKEKQIRYLKETKKIFLPWMKKVNKEFYKKLYKEIIRFGKRA